MTQNLRKPNRAFPIRKRLFDLLFASFLLLFTWPLFIIAALGIKFTSPGPILYRAARAGRHNHLFVMYKFRTMHLTANTASAITAFKDPRVFPFGSLLRKTKIDELPQLFNIIKGDMTVVGPRPEDPKIVALCYCDLHLDTLIMPPGLTSPGSIYGYTHGEPLIGREDPENDYTVKLLPMKLAIDLVYLNHWHMFYDLKVIFKTAINILQIASGKTQFSEPWECAYAKDYLVPAKNSITSSS